MNMKTEVHQSIRSTILMLAAVTSMVAMLLATTSCYSVGGRRALLGGAGGALAGGILGGGRGAVAGAVIGSTIGALSAPPEYAYYPPPTRYYGYGY